MTPAPRETSAPVKPPSNGGTMEMRVPTQKRCPKCGGILYHKMRYDSKASAYVRRLICMKPGCTYEGVV